MSRFLSWAAFALLGLVWASSLFAQHTVYSLATHAAVQNELGVTEDQGAKLRVLYEEESDTASQMAREVLPKLRFASAEYKLANAEIAKKLDAQFLPRLKEILKSEQFERLVQLQYQAQGPGIYSDPVVVDALEMTKEQQDQIAEISAHSQKKRESFYPLSLSGQAARATFTKEKEAALAKVLTAGQTQRLSRLKGKTFDHLPPWGMPIDEQQEKRVRLAKLLENQPVLEELKISDAVAAELKRVEGEEQLRNWERGQESNRESSMARDLPVAERGKKIRIKNASYYAKQLASEKLFATRRFALLTKPQLNRLHQLDIQDQGVDALFSEEVSAALNLTSEQQARILDICVAYGPKFNALLKLGHIPLESEIVCSTHQEVVALVKERTPLIDQVLGKEQLEKLAELRGQPFELSRLTPARRLLHLYTVPFTVQMSHSLLQVICREAVRKDLKLSPEEDTAIVASLAKFNGAAQDLQKMWDRGAQPPAEGSLQKIENLKGDCVAEVNKILKDSHRARLQQINLQRDWSSLRTGLGPGNLLELTGEQSRKMAAIEEETRQKRAAARGGGFAGFAGPPRNIALRQEIDAIGEALLLAVLTPEQLVKLKELQGPPFDVSIFDPLAQLPLPPFADRRDPLEAKFDQSVIDYVNDTLLREQDTNGDGSLDKSEWVKGKWSAANPPENSDLNKDGKLSREELCLRVSKSRGIPIKGEQPQPLPASSK